MSERGGFEALDACVHCGFCLQACPTFLATGDEADSPRGRIELMRALEAGELGSEDRFLTLHLDRCLGCRGCEPVCPSGVGYGHGLEAARERIARAHGVPRLARAALWALTTPGASRVVYAVARLLRGTGLPGRLAGWGRFRFAMGMLGATRPSRKGTDRDGRRRRAPAAASDAVRPSSAPSVLLFRGCIMDGLFAHVHDATIRTLAVNGYEVREVAGQVCCGALPAHAAQCCGSAGLFTLVEPAMSRAVLAPKLAALREAGPQVVATGNPGCLMQLGAGLAAAGMAAEARHPVELLDESYRAAGYYA